jgi:hypothetical protein
MQSANFSFKSAKFKTYSFHADQDTLVRYDRLPSLSNKSIKHENSIIDLHKHHFDGVRRIRRKETEKDYQNYEEAK